MANKLPLTAVIITHNSADILEKTLPNICKIVAEVIIIDNDSSDETINIPLKYTKQVHDLKENIGYGSSANLGIKNASYDNVIILNPDVFISHKALEETLKQAQENNIHIAAPNLHHHHKNELFYTKWLVGAAMLINTTKFDDIGFFDENIFLYFEETDLCKRVIDNDGKIAIIGQAKAEHLIGQSCPQNNRYEYFRKWHFTWSHHYYLAKHYSKIWSKIHATYSILRASIKLTIYGLLRKKKKIAIQKGRISGGFSYLIGRKSRDKNNIPRGLK